MTDVIERVRRRLAGAGPLVTPATVAALVRDEAGGLVGHGELLALVGRAQAELVGAGPLEPLLRDPQVTDVLVNGPAEVWVDCGNGLQRVRVEFADEVAVRRLAQRLASLAGRRLDDAQPWVDAPLPDGSRLHAVLPPVAPAGTCLSLRVLRPRAFTLDQLIEVGTLTPEAARLVSAVLASRQSFLVCGGTGSGKTTMLAALLSLVAPSERLVLVEDAPELRPNHPHVVRLAARPPNVEGAGAVTLRDLVRQALRMRPDRLVIGEVRGAEVVDLLTALNTGHQGGAGTVHANGASELPARLEALGALGGLSRAALHSQLAAAVRVVLYLRRDCRGRRVLEEICLLDRDGDWVRPRAGWRRDDGPCPAADQLADLVGDPVGSAAAWWPK